MQYLKEHKYYEDLYDLRTIEWGLRFCKAFTKVDISKEKAFKKVTKEKAKHDWNMMTNIVFWTFKGEEYKAKEKTIQDWVEGDRSKQDKYDNTPAPVIHCDNCLVKLKPISKLLNDDLKGNLAMQFVMKCPDCMNGKIVNENGQERIIEKPKCPKCGSLLIESHKFLETKTIWKEKCTNCNYSKKDIDDHIKWEKDRQEREKKDKELLSKYRSYFCLGKKEGEEYIIRMNQIKSMSEMMEKHHKQATDPAYQKAKKLKKLKVNQLKELLIKSLASKQYEDLQFGKPEMGKYVIIEFTVSDTNNTRQDRDSQNELKKIINKSLEKINWRLMSDGVIGRLGVLSGRLKGMEQEDDLIQTVREG
jgi:ribosomal protein S27E